MRALFNCGFIVLALVLFSGILPDKAYAALSNPTLVATTSSAVDQATFTTSSFSVTSGELIVIFGTAAAPGGGVANIEISDSQGLTWTEHVETSMISGLTIPGRNAVWTAVSNGNSMTVTFTPKTAGGAGTNARRWSVSILSVSGWGSVTNAKSATTTSTSIAVTLDGAPAASSMVVSNVTVANEAAVTPGSGFTEVTEFIAAQGNNGHTHQVQYDRTNATTAAAGQSWTGNASSSSVAIEITEEAADATPPTVSLTAPTDGSTVSGASVTISADASDNVGVSGVQFKRATNTLIDSEDTSEPYSISWDTTQVSDGSHTLIAVARDAAGNYATSTSRTVTVDNTAPVISNGSPSGTLSSDTTEVTLEMDTNETATCKYDTDSGTAYASMSGTFDNTNSTSHSEAVSGLTAGSHTYYVRCSDGQSNANSSDTEITFTISLDAVLGEAGGSRTGAERARARALAASQAGDNGDSRGATDSSDVSQVIANLVNEYRDVIMSLTSLGVEVPQFLLNILNEGKSSTPIYERDLTLGSRGEDVRNLQSFLINQNRGPAAQSLAAWGATGIFAELTRAALAEFQQSVGISPAQGYFGPITRRFLETN